MHVRAILGIVAISSLSTLVSSAENPKSVACVPPIVETQARCTFDIWGYVYDIDGDPFHNVYVVASVEIGVSDARGFYDIHLISPGTHRVTAGISGCGSVPKDVTVTLMGGLLNGGERYDIHMPCQAQP